MAINGMVGSSTLSEIQVLAPDVHPCVAMARPLRTTQGIIAAGLVMAEDSDGNLAPYEPGLATVAARANSTAYVLGNLVIPATPNGYYYVCTTAGTSDVAPPTYPTTEGLTVADGTVVWTNAGKVGTSSLTGGGVNVGELDTSKDPVGRILEHGGVVLSSLTVGYMGTAPTLADVKALKAIGIYPA